MFSRLVSSAFVFSIALSACGNGSDDGDTDLSLAATFPDYTPSFAVVARANDGVDQPQDLDFHPSRDLELWVVNKGTENSGSEVVIIRDVGQSTQDIEVRRDENAYHFMNTTTALAFSEDTENFATSPEITDANHSGGVFTGPSLWSSDLEVFAKPSGGNGSHLDMLHQSPNAMGIAHEVGDTYWVFDGYADELVRYAFGDDHGPGGEDHSDGKVERYSEVPIERLAGTPSHMVVDKATNWMYIADSRNGQVLRVDVTSGKKDSDLPMNMEPLARHVQMKNEVWEVFAENLDTPCGVDVKDGWLYVTDNGTGEIIAYDVASGAEIGRMQTDAKSLMGIKVGPDGLLYYVDRKADKVVRVDKN